jgi:hypothetical protein
MARTVLNQMAAVLVLGLGCASAAQAPSNAGIMERLVSPAVDAPPALDGKADDPAWAAAPKLSLDAERKLPPDLGAKTKVSLQSVHTTSKVYFLVTWEDTTESIEHKPWVWNAGKSAYEEGPEREDMCSLAFEHTGRFVADMLAPEGATWDVWHWKAARTNPQGFAMDKLHRYTRAKPEGKAKQYDARDGKPLWIARPEDSGDTVEVKQPAPATFAADKVPQYVPGTPRGSTADVPAKARWSDGRWTLEIERALDTGQADDTRFDLARSYRMALAVFDHTGDMDKATGVIELVFASRATRIDFEGDAPGAAPKDFRQEKTGGGAAGLWNTAEAKDAPSGGRILAQASTDDTDDRYPLCIYETLSVRDALVSVRFKAISGEVDQAAGVILRLEDKDNYYIARANALEDNVRLYKVVDGKRKQFAGTSCEVSPGAWHTLALEARGNHFRVFLDGALLFEADDATIDAAGRVGLWTKADSVTWFDDFEVVELGVGR